MKNTLLSIGLAALAALSACATSSEIVPIGPGVYMTGSAVRGGLSSDAEIRVADVKRASAFCSGQGRRLTLKSAESSGSQGWSPQNSQITFACE